MRCFVMMLMLAALVGAPAGTGLRADDSVPNSAANSAVGKVFVSDDFEVGQTGQPPANWMVYADEGNTLAIAEPPAAKPAADGRQATVGRRSVRFTDVGGTVWKPLLSGTISGEGGSSLRLDCDWFLPSTFDDNPKAFTVALRGDGNIGVATIAIGGPGGLAVLKKEGKYLPLRVPIKTHQWNHLTIICDPIAAGSKGAFDVIITQGEEELVFPNIPFTPNWHGDFPKIYWFSPTFALGGLEVAGPGREAYLDNVKVEVVANRPAH